MTRFGSVYTVTNHAYGEAIFPPEPRTDLLPWCRGWATKHVDYQDRGVAIVWCCEIGEEHDTIPAGLNVPEEGAEG